MEAKRHILVTSALPYANGELHLGHLVGYIQADIWVKFHQSCGHQCYYVCGDDAHGTPIMLSAEKKNIKPEALIQHFKQSHLKDFKAFGIDFNNFSTTHTNTNKQIVFDFYETLKQAGYIKKKTITQAYDANKSIFLPDRYVKGECPNCHAPNQYGDNCEQCGATYSPTELINPLSVLSNTTPIEKQSEHFFFDLPQFQTFLSTWLSTHEFQPSVVHKLQEWLKTELKAWDITRDSPYFGFKIPNTEDKYFYVWLDAPIGYLASFKDFCDTTKQPQLFNDFWSQESEHEVYHFIGKDIIYFHCLFWPALLKGKGYRLPNGIFANGFLTVNKQKMSKSRGTFITAKTYLNYLNPEHLRYYFCSKLNDGVDDIDLNLQDFIERVNSDLIGKFVNIASRTAMFLNKYFNNITASELHNQALWDEVQSAREQLATLFEQRQYSKAIRLIMQLADKINQYIDAQKPWQLIKEPANNNQVHQVCTQGLLLFRTLCCYLSPILPQLSQQVALFLNDEQLTWTTSNKLLYNHKLNKFVPLMQRIQESSINKMIEESKETITATTPAQTKTNNEDSLKSTISFDDFSKIDLRIAKIIKAEHQEGADKLLKITVNLGDAIGDKQIFAGIKAAYEPDALIGKLTIVVANLAPRKMRFGVSEGMILAAGPGGKDIWLLHPDTGAQPGDKVK